MAADLETVEALRRVAVHVVARARQAATGRFSLRITPGGFGTPEFGDDLRRVRVSGGLLVVESDAPGAAGAEAAPIDGSTLSALAELAGVDLSAPLDVGHDTPELGDVDAVIRLDADAVAGLGSWYPTVAASLDAAVADTPAGAGVSMIRLWPEHFDVAIDLKYDGERGVNLGGSPGDGFSAEPYVYVGPWGEERPGSESFWNAPFGAVRRRSELGDDEGAAITAFLAEGLGLLRQGS